METATVSMSSLRDDIIRLKEKANMALYQRKEEMQNQLTGRQVLIEEAKNLEKSLAEINAVFVDIVAINGHDLLSRNDLGAVRANAARILDNILVKRAEIDKNISSITEQKDVFEHLHVTALNEDAERFFDGAREELLPKIDGLAIQAKATANSLGTALSSKSSSENQLGSAISGFFYKIDRDYTYLDLGPIADDFKSRRVSYLGFVSALTSFKDSLGFFSRKTKKKLVHVLSEVKSSPISKFESDLACWESDVQSLKENLKEMAEGYEAMIRCAWSIEDNADILYGTERQGRHRFPSELRDKFNAVAGSPLNRGSGIWSDFDSVSVFAHP